MPSPVDEEVTAKSKNNKQAPLEKFLVSNKNVEKIQCGRRATRRVHNSKAAESNCWALKGREVEKYQSKSVSTGVGKNTRSKSSASSPPVK